VTARRPVPALLAAAPRPVPTRTERGGPVGIYRNAASAADAMLGALVSLPEIDSVLARAGIHRHQLRELEFDDEIAAALDTRRDAVLSTPWRLEGEDGERTVWVMEQLEPCIESILRGAWAAVPYGYSVMEAIYANVEGGRIGLASCAERPMEWFKLQRDGRVFATIGGLPEFECDQVLKWHITRRNPTWRNPAGDALLSRLYWPWHFRTNAWRFWLEFLERFGMPLMLGKGAQPQKLADALVAMGASAAMAVGLNEDVQAVTSGAAAGEFERAENALARRIQKLVLGQTLTTDVDGKGSYAAARVHDLVRQDRRNADLRLVRPTVQRIVNALWLLNRFPGRPPVFLQQDGQGLQLERAERDERLVKTGILQLSESYLLRTYDYEQGDISIPAAPAPRAPEDAERDSRSRAGAGRQAAAGAVTLAAAPAFTARQMEIEALGDVLLEEGGAPVPKAAIHAAIRAARDPEDLAERLAMLLPALPGSAFEELLARALFAADLIGYVQESVNRPALTSE
jgi:phage gp29-like protein